MFIRLMRFHFFLIIHSAKCFCVWGVEAWRTVGGYRSVNQPGGRRRVPTGRGARPELKAAPADRAQPRSAGANLGPRRGFPGRAGCLLHSSGTGCEPGAGRTTKVQVAWGPAVPGHCHTSAGPLTHPSRWVPASLAGLGTQSRLFVCRICFHSQSLLRGCHRHAHCPG